MNTHHISNRRPGAAEEKVEHHDASHKSVRLGSREIGVHPQSGHAKQENSLQYPAPDEHITSADCVKETHANNYTGPSYSCGCNVVFERILA